MPKKDFLRVWDITPDELKHIIDRAFAMKHSRGCGAGHLLGKSIGLYFEKPSTRTRVSFEVAVYQLGGQAITLSPNELQIGRGETIPDTAHVLSKYLDAIMMRTYSQELLTDFATHFTHPVINGLSDRHHPCQAIADMMTIKEFKTDFAKLKLVYVGDGNNVAHSLLEACSMLSVDITLACPVGYEPDKTIIAQAVSNSNVKIEVINDPSHAVKNADVVYTDVWVSMGQEGLAQEKIKIFEPYQVNAKLLKHAKPDAIVMHCLPAHRGMEITDEVLDSNQSVVITQAENRLHSTKSLLEFLL